MKTITLLGGSMLVIAAFSSTIFASDYADLNFIGFSLDGKYMAFEQYGKRDENDLDSDENYAETFFIEVAKDSYALPPSAYACDLGEVTQAACRQRLARYNAKTAAALKKLGIIRRNTGRQVVAHLLNDWSFVTPAQVKGSVTDANNKSVDRIVTDYMAGILPHGAGAETVVFNPDFFPPHYDATMFYELTLTSKQIPEARCFEGYRFDLTLSDKSHHKDLPDQILHKDNDNIPASRFCPKGYRIEQVYFYKNRVAVFINMFQQGFGIEMRYLSVTGKLNIDSVGPHALNANTSYEPIK
ncbi:MAG: DUF2259 domain-containing protein [Acidobacteriota bacterium]